MKPWPPLKRVRWKHCYRLIHTRSPSIDLFERIADPEDFDLLIELESQHNPRLRWPAGDLLANPRESLGQKSKSAYILAPFAYPPPQGSRFGTAQFGVFYGARSIATTIKEVCHHRQNFLKATKEAAMLLEMRLLSTQLDGRLYDLRAKQKNYPKLYHPSGYSASQAFGKKLKEMDAQGIVYDSVRDSQGQCAALFKPQVLSQAQHLKYLYLRWDGEKIGQVFEEFLDDNH